MTYNQNSPNIFNALSDSNSGTRIAIPCRRQSPGGSPVPQPAIPPSGHHSGARMKPLPRNLHYLPAGDADEILDCMSFAMLLIREWYKLRSFMQKLFLFQFASFVKQAAKT